MAIDFHGQVAIVTGAGAGLGRSHALLLASLGARVVVNDPGKTKDPSSDRMAADEVVAEILAAGGQAIADYGAVGTLEAAQAMVDHALKAFGRVDILVNNAGILRDRTFTNMTELEWEQVLQVHLTGSAFCTKAVWPVMKEQRSGRIVFTTSNAGLFGSFGQGNYAAAKMGLIGLMNVLKHEGEKYNILVNVIAPVAATSMTEGLLDPQTLEYFVPGHASAAVAAMCSKEFLKSGVICSAFAGHFALIEVCSTGGIQLDPTQPPSPDELLRRWDDIADRTSMHHFFNSSDEMSAALKAVSTTS